MKNLYENRIFFISNKKLKINTKWMFIYAFMILLVSFMALPLIYLVNHAFKPLEELILFPPTFFVRRPVLLNFKNLFLALDSSTVPFSRFVFNSAFITVFTVLFSVITCSMGAYIISKFDYKFAKIVFAIVIAALMFPKEITHIPTYFIIKELNLLDTYAALMLPKIAVPFNFFLMKQFIDQFPNELIEASRLDGASEPKIYWKIIMPGCKAAVSTLLVFSFTANWNDTFSSLVYTYSQELKVLPLVLTTIEAGLGRMGAQAAASLIMTLPTVVIFVLMQKRVLTAMSYSGIKS